MTHDIPRSSLPEVRNPLLAIPEVQAEIATLSDESSAALERILLGLSKTFRAKGEEAWRKHKPPMAAYYKANAVNARHLALALRRGRVAPASTVEA